MKNKMNEEIRTWPVSNCPLCSASGTRIYQGLTDRLPTKVPGAWNLRKCTNAECHLIWQDPMVDERDMTRLYQRYYTHEPGRPAPSSPGSSVKRKCLRNAITARAFGYRELRSHNIGISVAAAILANSHFIRDRIGRGLLWLEATWRGRLLDFGCGNGEYMARMRDLGWDTVGYDTDPLAAQIARKQYSLIVFDSSINKANLPSDSFDVITMSHVIEHLFDPTTILKTCARLLKPGGRLVVLTPNAYSLGHRWLGKSWHYLDPPRHTLLFSVSSLKYAAVAAGLDAVRIWTSANNAVLTWAKGQSIRRNGLLDGFDATGLALRDIWTGWFFWALEHSLTYFLPKGEEVIMIAQKR